MLGRRVVTGRVHSDRVLVAGTTPKAPDDALAAFTPASASRRVLLPQPDSRCSTPLLGELFAAG
jgi:hypothetical protein